MNNAGVFMCEAFCKFWKAIGKPFFAFALILCLCLWVWNSGVYYRKLPAPSLAVHTPARLLQACANRTGLQLLAIDGYGKRRFAIVLERATRLGDGGYHHGFVLNVLGFTLAIVPNTVNGGDYIVPPHFAVVFPYWFLITCSAIGFLWAWNLLGPLTARLHFSRVSKVAMISVLLLFLALNFIPSHSLGGRVHRILGWVTLVFWPEVLPETTLNYGFPFECYRTAIIGGKKASFFYGHELGWKQERLMENLLAALLAAFAVGIAIERLKRKEPTIVPAPRQPLPPAPFTPVTR